MTSKREYVYEARRFVNKNIKKLPVRTHWQSVCGVLVAWIRQRDREIEELEKKVKKLKKKLKKASNKGE